MTHNQIDYWNMIETKRHNMAMEQLNQQDVDIRAGTLSEATRHNVAQEGLGLATIHQQDISSQRATAAQRYASELGYSSSLYAADTSRYGYDLNALTQQYNTELNAGTQRYIADVNAATQRYNTDISSLNTERQAQATERGQTLNSATTVWRESADKAYAWYQQNTNPMNYINRFNVDLGGLYEE